MSDHFTKEFFAWLEKGTISKEEAAEQLGNSVGTLANWRSGGIPKGKQYACRALMDRTESETEEVPNRLQIEVSREEFNRWNRASLNEGLIIETWAYFALRDAADEWEKSNTELRAVAEDEQHYGNTKSHIRAAAGSPVNCELIDWDGENPTLNVEVYGLSMDPLFHDGQIIQMTHKSAARSQFMKKGLIYLIRHNGGFMIKRYNTRKARPDEKDAEYLTKTGTVGILESINPSYKPIDITDPDGTEWIAWYDEK